MRNVFGLFFLILYLIALIRPFAPLLEYYSNQDFFAKVLCINQDKPEMGCNGQCILMQKLKKANTESNLPVSEAPLPKVNLKDYPIGFVLFVQNPSATTVDEGDGLINLYQDQLSCPILREIFHPPSLSFPS